MQLTSLYGGPQEYLLVVESTEDPAYNAVAKLITELEVHVKFILRFDSIVLVPLQYSIAEQFSVFSDKLIFSASYLDVCLMHAGFC